MNTGESAYESESESHSIVSDSLQPGQNAGVGSLIPSPGDLPNPGIEPRSPALQVNSLPAELPGKLECIEKRKKNLIVFLRDKSQTGKKILTMHLYDKEVVSEYIKNC